MNLFSSPLVQPPERERTPIRRLIIIEMTCVGYSRFLLLALTVLLCSSPIFAQRNTPRANPSSSSVTPQQTTVTLRWGVRTGVSRYRLQLANDSAFNDIVFDRVVNGNEYRTSDLPPGKYFWRVAPLDQRLGEFSSAGVIEVGNNKQPTFVPVTGPAQTAPSITKASSVVATRGWNAVFAGISKTISAHLRSAQSAEIVVTTNDGRVIAVDGLSGVALWIRRFNAPTGAMPIAIAIRDGGAFDNVFVSAGTTAMLFEGKTGRELWHGPLPSAIASAVAADDTVFALDESFQHLLLVNAGTGKTLLEVRLTGRAVGAPVITDAFGSSSVMVALANGQLQVFDRTGKMIRSGDAAAAVTTAPLLVRTPRGPFVLVGTRNGLTALNAEDLRPLGRVTLKDSPQGSLFAQDLDNDGTPEVGLFTDNGRVVIVKADEGKVIWEADAKHAEASSFADINDDRVWDLLMTGREGSAFALSGRDGAVIWKEETPSQVVTNHSTSSASLSSLVVSSPSAVLFIATEPGRGDLRAFEFTKGIAPRK